MPIEWIYCVQVNSGIGAFTADQDQLASSSRKPPDWCSQSAA
jgi:hypothetical protein